MLYPRAFRRLAILALALPAAPLASAQLSVGITDYADVPDSATGNNAPARLNLLTTDPNGRLFVNDQRGPLYTIDPNTRAVTPYLDLSNDALYPTLDLNSGNEPGFQSFAFHPDFYNTGTAGFGRFYTIHSSNNTTPTPDFDPGGNTAFHSVLLEWQTDNPNASTFQAADNNNPFREVLRLDQPFGNHNAGQLAFNSTPAGDPGGSDRGNLYIAVGDGGDANDPQSNGQNANNPFGAILRIDPLGNDAANGQYGLVSDNAFASDADPNTLAEIYAFGLRNPQRFGWDDNTGNLYIADIGQSAFEEINLATNGGNFGWATHEGSGGGTGLIDPIAEYNHGSFLDPFNPTTGSRAITTGEVVRNSGIPGLDGQLLLADFPNGVLFALDVDNDPFDGGSDGLTPIQLVDDNGNNTTLIELINAERATQGLDPTTRADLRFSFGLDGEVFILNKRDGTIRQLTLIPEPTSLALLTLGGLILSRRRRSRG